MKKLIEKTEAFLEWGGLKKDISLLVISGFALLINLFRLMPSAFNTAWIAVILCGIPIILEAIIGLVTEFDITADVLVAIALVASVFIGEIFAAGEVAFIMQLGALLEDLTVARARAGIEKLVHLTPRTARILTENGEQIVKAEEVRTGNILRVLPGETIPVDGVILSGNTSINQAVMTGESLPVDRGAGDEVSSGTVNQFGSFDMEATRVGEDSSIQRMIRLVQSADAGKAKVVSLADKWAVWIVILAISASILTYLFTRDIIRSVTILVVFCPCALVLATPTAIMAAIGNVTKHGFLVREGDALERLSDISMITFDKTGTLTYGTLEVTALEALSDVITKDRLLQLTAAAESRSEHPIGKAIVGSFKSSALPFPEPENFTMIPGRGVQSVVDGVEVLAGNEEFMLEQQIPISNRTWKLLDSCRSQGSTAILVACNKELSGLITLSDTLRENVRETIHAIKETRVVPVLLTGDNRQSAQSIAGSIGIMEVSSNLLPEDKLSYIEESQKKGEKICMIGDGVNDAPALKTAYVGIAMGGIGSDIAVEAADIALVNDDIQNLPHLIALSRHMMRVIKANLTFSMTLNFIAITLAITGILNPVVGALVHNAGSVFVIINSSLLLKWRKK